jgi:hypothetical protein
LLGHGSTYVRWGRSECAAPNTEMIYEGTLFLPNKLA